MKDTLREAEGKVAGVRRKQGLSIMKRKNRWRLQRVKRNLNVLVSVRSHKRPPFLKWFYI